MDKYVKRIKAAKMAIRKRIKEMKTVTFAWQEVGEDGRWHQFLPYKEQTKRLPAKIVKGTWNVCRDYTNPHVWVTAKRPNGKHFVVSNL